MKWIDRTGWPTGPWDDEPDRADWIDAATGTPCLALRNAIFGSWSGYVLVGPRHPWHGRGYDDIVAEVHGELTFAGPSNPDPRPDTLCLLGESDRGWWVGFDCVHLYDFTPKPSPLNAPRWGGSYRDLDYVRAQCHYLALQARAAEVGIEVDP